MSFVRVTITFKWKRPSFTELTKITDLPSCMSILIVDYFASETESFPLRRFDAPTMKLVLLSLWRSWGAKISQSDSELSNIEEAQGFIGAKEFWSHLPSFCARLDPHSRIWFEPLPWKPRSAKCKLETTIQELEYELVKRQDELADAEHLSFMRWSDTTSGIE
jgi:hypothetical protein